MSLEQKMNAYLADQQVMYTKLHNLHWYIKGSQFFVLHAKFEELYNSTADILDEVAERMLTLGFTPVANLKDVLAITGVKELENKPIDSKEAITVLTNDIQWWINNSKELIKLADEADDVVTADLFTGYLAEYEKTLWMLKAYNS